MSKRRFFIESKDIKNGKARLKDAEHHHLSRVLRLQSGDEVYLFTEKAEEFRAEVAEIKKANSLLIIKEGIKDKKPEGTLRVALLQGIPRGGRMDMIVQKSTELGVERIVPLLTERSVQPKNSVQKQERWQRISLEAAKQCGRREGIQISMPIRFEKIDCDQLPQWRLILSEKEGRGIKEIVSDFEDNTIALMVGPEGGWSDKELNEAIDKRFIPINLGPRILRTETASLVALSILQYTFGDIGNNE